MQSYNAIYNNGTIHLPEPLPLPNNTPIKVIVDVSQAMSPSTLDAPPRAPAGSLERIYELLSQGAETGIPDLAARHNEHQP
jgi:hypothetical protein